MAAYQNSSNANLLTLPNFTKNLLNNAHEGKVYESQIVLSTFLLLKQGQQLQCEIKEAGNFDDVVVHVDNDGFYLRQVKHKQDRNFVLKETDLFGPSRSDMYFIDKYMESFIEKISQSKPFAPNGSNVKELTLTTNVVFHPSFENDYLEDAGKSQVWDDIWDTKTKRYRFKPSKFNEIRRKLRNTKKFQSNDIDIFLAKLVFETSHPDIEAQEIFIRQKVTSLIPLKLSDKKLKEAADVLQNNLQKYLDDRHTVRWANVQLRQEFLLQILVKLRKGIVSTLNYDGRILQPLLEDIESIQFPPDVQGEFETNVENSFINIVVPPEKSMPVLSSCKVLSYYQKRSVLDKVWFVEISSKKDGECLENIFKHQNVEIFNDCTFVVEFSQKLKKDDITSQVNRIFEHFKKKEQFVKFIFITSDPVNSTAYNGQVKLLQVIDYLFWECFTVNGCQNLREKTLALKNGASVSLERLDISLVNLSSLALSELVLADENSQLDLLLPQYDTLIKETYVHRKLRLPVLDISEIDERQKDQLSFDPDDFNTRAYSGKPVHLLGNLESLNIRHKHSKDFFLLTKIKNVTKLDKGSHLRKCMENTSELYKVKVVEDILISDIAMFDSSQNIKAAIVVDLPGMGKSTLLTHLTNKVLDLGNDGGSMKKLVVRVNLGSCRKEAWDASLERITDAIHFLSLYSKRNPKDQPTENTSNTTNVLSNNILEEIFNASSSWSVIVMLDGFDEISDKGRAFVVKTLLPLLLPMQGVNRIIVTSRPVGGVHERLETLFSQFAMHLVELDPHDQKRLLYALWRKRIRDDENAVLQKNDRVIEERCKIFSKKLVSVARCQLKDKDRTILDIPLQCILFASCFYDNLKKYIEGGENFPAISDHAFDLLTLFNTFIDKKFDIFYREKQGLNNENDAADEMYQKHKKSLVEQAMRVSVYYMTRNKTLADYEMRDGTWDAEKFKEDMSSVKKLGLLAHFDEDALVNGQVNFEMVHRTFAEYLVAKYLACLFQETSKNSLLALDVNTSCDIYELLLDIVLRNAEFEGVRRFFSRIIKPLLPNERKRCPFQVQDRNQIARELIIFNCEKFNDRLANYIISDCSKLFALPEEMELFLPLFKWLMLCLKEHVARNQTEDSMIELIEIVGRKTIEFISSRQWHVNDEFLSKVASIPLEQESLSFLLTWHIHSTEVEKTKLAIKKNFSDCLRKIEEKLNNQIVDPLHKLHILAAVGHSVTRQRRYLLDESSVRTTFGRFFYHKDENCEASQLVHHPIDEFIDEFNIALGKTELEFIETFFEIDTEKRFKLENIDLSVCFRDFLEIGSPEFWDNDTSLLEEQVRWFLSLSRKSFSSKNNQSDKGKCWMNPFFLVACVEYFLLMIDRFVVDESKGNELRQQVARQALRLDVRIFRWLGEVHVFVESGNVDKEPALRRAINLLPGAHQAAYDGNVPIKADLLLQKDSLLHWTGGLSGSLLSEEGATSREKKDEFNADSPLVKAFRGDCIPPAVYLAAAKRQFEFCRQVSAELLKDKKDLASFIFHCSEYALEYVDDGSVVLPFVEAAKANNFTKEEFCNIFVPLTQRYAEKMKPKDFSYGEHEAESLFVFTLVQRGWAELLIEFLDVYTENKRKKMSHVLEIASENLKIIIQVFFRRGSLKRSYFVNALLHCALESADNARVVYEEFYTLTGQRIARGISWHLYQSYDGDLSLSIDQEMKIHQKTILYAIWDNVEDESKFVKFVCANADHVFGYHCKELNQHVYSECDVYYDRLEAALCNDVVQEFFPHKLSKSGTDVLTGVLITAYASRGNLCWLDTHLGGHLCPPSKGKQIGKFLKNFALHLVEMIGDTKTFEKIFFHISRLSPSDCTIPLDFMIPRSTGSREVVNYLKEIKVNETLIKRFEILHFYRNEILSNKKLSLDKFHFKTFIKKCFREFAPGQRAEGRESASLKELEILFTFDCTYPVKDEFFSQCMDVAIKIMRFLLDEFLSMSGNPANENELSVCWSKSLHEESRFRLLLAVTLTRTLVKIIEQVPANDDEASQFIDSLLEQLKSIEETSRNNVTPDRLNFLASLGYLFGSDEFSRTSSKKKERFEFLYSMPERKLTDKNCTDALNGLFQLLDNQTRFFENMDPNKTCQGLVMLLINVALTNRWII